MRGTRLALLLASATAGIAATAFIWVAERSLGSAKFEPIAHLWTIWSIAAAVLTHTFEQSEIRHRVAGTHPPRKAQIVIVALSVACVFFVAAAGSERLFGESSWIFVVIACLIPVGSAVVGQARGLWASLHRFRMFALVVASENTSRTVIATVLFLLGIHRSWLFGLAILLGFAVAAVRPRSSPDSGSARGRPSSLGLVSFVVCALGLHLSLTSAPTVVALAGASDQSTTGLFLALAVARGPLLLVLSNLSTFSVRFSALARDEDWREIVRAARSIMAAVLALCPAAYLVCHWLLTPVTALMFGDSELSQTQSGLIGLAVCLAGGIVFLTALLVAVDRTVGLAAIWTAAIAGAAVVLWATGRTHSIGAVLSLTVVVQSAVLGGGAMLIWQAAQTSSHMRSVEPSAQG